MPRQMLTMLDPKYTRSCSQSPSSASSTCTPQSSCQFCTQAITPLVSRFTLQYMHGRDTVQLCCRSTSGLDGSIRGGSTMQGQQESNWALSCSLDGVE